MQKNSLEKLERFFHKFKPFNYKKRHLVLQSFDVSSGVFFVKKGYVRQYILSQSGEEFTTIIYKRGDIFPLKWAINNQQDTHSFETLSEAVLVKAPRKDFVQYLKSDSDVFFKLISRIINRNDVLLERMEYLVFGHAYSKVASIILTLAERFGVKIATLGTVIQVPLTHKDIASLLGLTRETVSIEIKKLEKENIIICKRHKLRVLDLERLRKESSFEEL